MSYNDEYYCPYCNATLNDQPGFDPELGAWTCIECGQTLYGEEIEATMDQFDGVVWYCDSCGALLNKQSGFNDYCGIWYCTDCGYANPINENEIYNSEADYQNRRESYECPSCGHTLNDQSWFDENADTVICSWCGNELYKDSDDYRILYKCPHCGAELKDQWGFDEDDYWTCQVCNTHLSKESDAYCEEENNTADDNENSPGSSSDCKSSTSTTKQSYQSYAKKQPTTEPDNIASIRTQKTNWKASLVRSLIIILAIIVGAGCYEYTKLITVNHSVEDLVGAEYKTVVMKLENAGFSDVTVSEIPDLKIQSLNSKNLVTEVKIGWVTSFSKNSRIPSNFPVVVTYHTLEKVYVPMASKEAKRKNYKEVKKAFEKAGFVNIILEPEYDIITGWLTDDGEVESVVIGETKKFYADSKYQPDETVTITYHTFKKNRPE